MITKVFIAVLLKWKKKTGERVEIQQNKSLITEEHEAIEKAQVISVISVPADLKEAPGGEGIESYVPGF